MDNPEQITYFGQTDARNRQLTFGIKAKDRTKHVYAIGKTGMGKSTLLENMAVQDIRNGNGFAFIDPHGKSADLLLEYIPKERIKDVIYFAPFDMEYPIAFNVMEDVGYDKRHLVVSGLMSTFKKIWQDAWSARMEYILGNTLLALLEYPGATLLEVNKMLADKEFRNKVVANVPDFSVKSFWVDEFAKYTDKFAAEATPAIQNKIGQFTANPLIRNIIGQEKSSFDLRKAMDDKKILIINLSKGRIGESNANLLGSMLITKIYLAALSRADISEAELQKSPNFYLYVDEFQSFANESFADILSEARKYKLNLTIAHQYIEQMSEEVRAAVFGNVGTMVTFRVGATDAEIFEKEFAPTFLGEDIVNLGAYQMYLRLMIDGIGSKPFSARSLPPLAKEEISNVREIIELSRATYAASRPIVEERLRTAHKSDSGKSADKKESAPVNKGQSNDRGRVENKSDGRGEQRMGREGDHRNSKPVISNTAKRQIEEKINPKPQLQTQPREDMWPDLDIEPDYSPIETVSLADIKNKTKRPNDKKGPTPENKNSLKNALADILKQVKEEGGAPQKPADNKSDSVSARIHEPKPRPEPQANPQFKPQEQQQQKPQPVQFDNQPKNQSKNEIAEDELRRVLGLD